MLARANIIRIRALPLTSNGGGPGSEECDRRDRWPGQNRGQTNQSRRAALAAEESGRYGPGSDAADRVCARVENRTQRVPTEAARRASRATAEAHRDRTRAPAAWQNSQAGSERSGMEPRSHDQRPIQHRANNRIQGRRGKPMSDEDLLDGPLAPAAGAAENMSP